MKNIKNITMLILSVIGMVAIIGGPPYRRDKQESIK
jgi:hypothetical protein